MARSLAESCRASPRDPWRGAQVVGGRAVEGPQTTPPSSLTPQRVRWVAPRRCGDGWQVKRVPAETEASLAGGAASAPFRHQQRAVVLARQVRPRGQGQARERGGRRHGVPAARAFGRARVRCLWLPSCSYHCRVVNVFPHRSRDAQRLPRIERAGKHAGPPPAGRHQPRGARFGEGLDLLCELRLAVGQLEVLNQESLPRSVPEVQSQGSGRSHCPAENEPG